MAARLRMTQLTSRTRLHTSKSSSSSPPAPATAYRYTFEFEFGTKGPGKIGFKTKQRKEELLKTNQQ